MCAGGAHFGAPVCEYISCKHEKGIFEIMKDGRNAVEWAGEKKMRLLNR